MKWFYNLKIAVKLIIGFVFVAIIAGAVGVIGILNISSTNTKYSELFENHGVALGIIGQADVDYQLSRISLRDILINRGSTDRGKT
jgi:methyl-accepting chemotaxis protein